MRRAPPTWRSCRSGSGDSARSSRRRPMPTRSSVDYAVVRVVPRVARGEQINAGVILYCRTRDYLAARIAVDRGRLSAIEGNIDVDEIEEGLAMIPLIC